MGERKIKGYGKCFWTFYSGRIRFYTGITNKLVKEAVADTEDAYALQSMSAWWLLLLSFIALNTTLLLWWKGLL